MGLVLVIAGVVFFAGASFFFALAELSLFSLGKWQVKQLSEKSPVPGLILGRILQQPADLLATITLGNSLSNGSLVALLLWSAMGGFLHLWIALLLALAIIMVVGEVIPKTLAVRAPEIWSLRIARPMLLLMGLTRPLRQIAQRINETLMSSIIRVKARPLATISNEDYQELLEMAFQQGTLAAGEKEIILQIINLDRRTASEVMKPRSRMFCISDELSREEMIEAARKFKHSKLPVYDENPDTIVGILKTRALLLNPDIDLEEVIEFPSFVPESMNLLQLFKSLQRQQRGMAIVLDEFGGTAGIVTMEDILEEVIGQIKSEEKSEQSFMERTGENRWVVNGTYKIEDFSREYSGLGTVQDVDTMGGLMVHEMEVVPVKGQSVVFKGLKLTAIETDERRVRRLLVEVAKKK